MTNKQIIRNLIEKTIETYKSDSFQSENTYDSKSYRCCGNTEGGRCNKKKRINTFKNNSNTLHYYCCSHGTQRYDHKEINRSSVLLYKDHQEKTLEIRDIKSLDIKVLYSSIHTLNASEDNKIISRDPYISRDTYTPTDTINLFRNLSLYISDTEIVDIFIAHIVGELFPLEKIDYLDVEKLNEEMLDKMEITKKETYCDICMEECESKKVLNCKHSFCKACISKALSIKNSCPMCRKPQETFQLTALQKLQSKTPNYTVNKFRLYSQFEEITYRVLFEGGKQYSLTVNVESQTGRIMDFLIGNGLFLRKEADKIIAKDIVFIQLTNLNTLEQDDEKNTGKLVDYLMKEQLLDDYFHYKKI